MLARLKPGATQAQAQSQIDGLNARNEERYPQFKRLIAKSGFRTTVQGLRDQLIGGAKAILFLLWGGALLVLIIGCVNVMNLVAVRATARSRELTTRVVLGASLTAIARQILTESLVLAGLGGSVGLVLGWWALQAVAVLGIERDLMRGTSRTIPDEVFGELQPHHPPKAA